MKSDEYRRIVETYKTKKSISATAAETGYSYGKAMTDDAIRSRNYRERKIIAKNRQVGRQTEGSTDGQDGHQTTGEESRRTDFQKADGRTAICTDFICRRMFLRR